MRNDHDEVRKKVHNHGKGGMKQNSTNLHSNLKLAITNIYVL